MRDLKMWTPSHVRVTVHQARNLLGKGKNGKNDAFVVIQLKKEKFHTSVKEMTVNPEWHEECDLTIPEGRSSLMITVLHRNIIGIDKFIGEVACPLCDFDIYDRPKPRWFTLENKASKKHKAAKKRGEIEVKLEFVVKDVPQSTPLPQKKNRTNSLINLANDVGSKLNSRFPSQRWSAKLGKKQKFVESDNWYRQSFSEEEFSPQASKHDINNDLDGDDGFGIDSEPATPTIQSEEMYNKRSQSISILPLKTSQSSSNVFKESKSDWNRLFNPNLRNPQVQSMEDIHNGSLADNQHARAGSLSNLNGTTANLPIPKRRNTEPPIQSISTTDVNDNSSPPNHQKLQRKLGRSDKMKSTGSMFLKPCYENEIVITSNKRSKISSDILESYGALNREELLDTIVSQKLLIENQRNKMKDMENYIDNLLLRVMNAMPKLLQTPIVQYKSQESR